MCLDSRSARRVFFTARVPCGSIRDVPSREPDHLLRISCFEVLIGNKEIGFAEVGRLTSETEPGVSADRPVHRFPTVVLKRALTTSTELYDWRRLIVGGKDDRRDVTIRQLSARVGDRERVEAHARVAVPVVGTRLECHEQRHRLRRD